MNGSVIAVDCDEVLAETRDAMLAYHNYTFNGKAIRKEMFQQFAFREQEEFDATVELGMEYFRSFFCSTVNHAVKPVKGAYEKLSMLVKQWYQLMVVTGRNSLTTKEYTQQRIEKHFPELFSDIVFANHYGKDHMKKSVLCKKIGATTLIEDCLENVIECAEEGISWIVLAKPRNAHYDKSVHENIQRVQSRDEIQL